jgi:hypothetical protein
MINNIVRTVDFVRNRAFAMLVFEQNTSNAENISSPESGDAPFSNRVMG